MAEQDQKSIFLAAKFPQLSQELQQLLIADGEIVLAAQVPELIILDRCRCEDDFCATFYVQPKPAGAYGPGHRCIPLDPNEGMLILDVLDERIAAIEILYRNDIRQELLAEFH